MARLIHPVDLALRDNDAEQVRRNHDERIKQLAGRPAFALTPIGEATLPDGVLVKVGHSLGRFPSLVLWSPPRGAVTAGLLEEVREGLDRCRFVGLRASGFGATVRVDVGVL